MSSSVPAIERMDRIFQLLAERPEGVSLSGISQALGIPKTTTFRLLSTLEELGYVESASRNGLFRIGYKMGIWARESTVATSLVEIGRPILKRLAEETRQTAKISVVRNNHAVVIAKHDSPEEMRIYVKVGAVFPLHTGAASRILLAWLPETDLETYLASGLDRFTENTLADQGELLGSLETIRNQGYAIDDGEYLEGVGAVAVPIRGFGGTVVAALSLPYINGTVDKNEQRRLITRAQAASDAISRALGYDASNGKADKGP
jgi:DNA-binding IclR family transcriptional regulator